FAVGPANQRGVKEFDVPGSVVARPDDFLRGDEPAVVGGAERSGEGGKFFTKTPGAYSIEEPDGDERGPADEGLGAEGDMDAPIAGPANFSAPRPGGVGGVPVRVRKARDAERRVSRGVFS